MVEVNWSKQAIEDIHQIREYYQSRSIKYADFLTDRLFEKATQLENHPEIGRVVPELQNTNIRELIFKNYRIIYRCVSASRVDIIAIHNSLRPLSEQSVFE